jgi:hypothetical protein
MSTTDNINNITVKEFKMWLAGVIEMQDDDWIPDARQWQKVLDKIFDIADNITPTRQHNFEDEPVMYRQRMPESNQYYRPTELDNSMPLIQQPSALFAGGNSNLPTVTPNIDSVSGYDTPFI